MPRPDLMRMLDAAREMSDIRDLEPLIAFVLAEARSLTDARRGSLILWEAEPLVPASLRFGQDGRVLGSFPDPARPAAWEPSRLCVEPTWEPDSTLCLPLLYRGASQGAIVLERPQGPSGADLAELLARFGEHASVCIRNALLNRRMEAEVRYLSEYDAVVTKLPNRIVFHREVAAAIRGAGSGQRSAVLLMDLDDFEAVNRRFGHRVGDQFLFQVARRIAGFARDRGPGSLAARIGGDEFALMLTGLTSHREACRAARGLLEDLRRPFELGESRHRMTASIGIGLAPDDGRSAEDVVLHADQAMYAAKARGKDTYGFYRPPPALPGVADAPPTGTGASSPRTG
jgi:diguanylate cyclase (GGDEF)-like protein